MRKYHQVHNTLEDELMTGTTITSSQKALYDFIRGWAYLNSEMPSAKDIFNFLGEKTIKNLQKELEALEFAGLLKYNTERRRWTLVGSTLGMCRVRFGGEIWPDGLRQTKEEVCNFFDLVNTETFTCFRLLTDLKFKDYKLGDYLIVSKLYNYRHEIPILYTQDDLYRIGNLTKRTHDTVIQDHASGRFELAKIDNTIGEVVGVIRLETSIDRIFTKSRVKVVGREFNIPTVE